MENIGNRAWISSPTNEQHLKDSILKDERQTAMKMADNAMKLKRSPNQVFILLVGLSGAGKSATVDNLFGTDVGKARKFQSVARSTIEYTLKLKSDEFRIQDLRLSIIDTPGFCDNGGLLEDAKNIVSIKHFLESNPYIGNRFPNLVMIIHNILDNRITGYNSNFVQMLKGINNVNVIDAIHQNVVVVLTHAMGIARNPTVWTETIELKKAQIQTLVQVYLGINPEIVVIENEPEDNELERDGNSYFLPNGDRQPHVLYQACERILKKANDVMGHAAIADCCRRDINKSVIMGQTIPSSAVKIEDAQSMLKNLLNWDEMVLTSEVGSMLEDYKKQIIAKELVNEIFILQVRLGNLGISRKRDLQNMSMEQIVEKMYPTRINQTMQNVLEEVFRLSYEQSAGDTVVSADSLGSFQEDSLEMLHGTATLVNSYNCFYEDSIVTLHNQKQKRMKNLSVGDKILTADRNGRLTQDEVIAWLHRVRDGHFTFLQIVHDQGKMMLTPEHIVFVGKSRQPKHASTLRPGDQLLFFTNCNDGQTATISIVLSIEKVKGRGIYAPLTYGGRLLVDQVVVSCYCTISPLQAFGKEIISSHALAHVGFLPLRMVFKFGFNINKCQLDDKTGMHGYARWLIKCVLERKLKV